MSHQHRSRRHEAKGFTCIQCRLQVPGESWGTKHRNHCPGCLHSRHVDEHPGDRASPCRGTMEPIGVEVRGGDRAGEWAIIHRCRSCGVIKVNRIAGDDSERSLLALALRPLARPAFPLDDLR
ncbi:MAG: RNHCP domain-containing protein [Phycisphaerales bacterium]